MRFSIINFRAVTLGGKVKKFERNIAGFAAKSKVKVNLKIKVCARQWPEQKIRVFSLL